MGKAVFLVLYLWHGASIYRGGLGGPQVVVQPMPSLSACEAVGKATKDVADSQRPFPDTSFWHKEPCCQPEYRPSVSLPAVYRCIEVPQ
mgnify:FL=1